jgi:hypothetical protein
MGNVYRGITDTGLEVAVKICDWEELTVRALHHEWEIYAMLTGLGATGETVPVCYGFAESGGPEDESGFSVLVLECIGDGKPAVNDFCQLPLQDRSSLPFVTHVAGTLTPSRRSQGVPLPRHARPP